MTFNVHTLKHVIKFVKYFGSLWAWSAFPFESYNAVIKSLFHGTQCIADQICKSYFRLKYIKSQSSVFEREECNVEARSFYIKLMNECRVKDCICYNDDLRLFNCKPCVLSELEESLLEIYFETTVSNIVRCDRFIYKNILFHSLDYKRLQKRNNSCFINQHNEIYMVQKLIKVQKSDCINPNVVIVARQVNVLHVNLSRGVETPNYMFIVRKTPNLTVFETSSIDKKCIYRPVTEEEGLVVPLVNKMETD